MSPGYLLLFFIFFSPGQNADSAQKEFLGCLSRLPDGTLQLGALPSGKSYSIQGNTKPLMGHVNQVIRIHARSGVPKNQSQNSLTLTANSVQVIAETCTAGLPGSRTEPVGGRVGEDQIAVPMTTTASSAETTPGFQTEAGTAQLTGKSPQAVLSGLRPPVPYAPFKPEQVAQSESAANVNANAALRAEILPGNTLGVSGSAPVSPAAPTGGNSNHAAAGTVSATSVVVEITGDQNAKLSRQRVSIKTGETVEWRNSSNTVHEIVANPAKAKPASKPVLPTGASPFDSGFVRPDRSFVQRFTVPGLYRYICDLDSAHPVEGEVMVTR
ncbi:MAG TPA: hypothetical protein VGS27_29190 [Candidatus Sulfotelmatobacter sp.]|nr:hypothetical protein [Candidatus Sulfotelmatobacter sp.]